MNKYFSTQKAAFWLRSAAAILLIGGFSSVQAESASCYSVIDYVKPADTKPERALYVLVDQTTPLSGEMRQRISALLETWGKPGDLLKVAHFSANLKGKYPQLVFSQQVDRAADQAYTYQLRYKDKQELMACLEKQQMETREQFQKEVKNALAQIDTKTPKTELLFSLKELSKFVIKADEAKKQTVLLITDGMENTPGMSFYASGSLRKINPQAEISKVRRSGNVGFWKGVEVYMYGVGLMENEKKYPSTERISQLRAFWDRYFVEGGARVKAIGTPELLVTAIE